MIENPKLQKASETIEKLSNAVGKIIKGREDTTKLVLTGMLADGHVLLEDYPGSGKTTLAKTLGQLIDCRTVSENGLIPFRRIQFTPDLLPSDVLGVNVFEPNTATFSFMPGPIFAHVVLADEINRTGPKVQAAFLECMAERQVTIDNSTYALDELFFVIGTQNPLDLAGTYPLPLVQLDRFLLKIPMTYVDKESELDILNNAREIKNAVANIEPVVSREEIVEAREALEEVTLAPSIREAIVNIVQSTRDNPSLQFGVSTRAALMLQRALLAWAVIEKRDYVNEDDLKYLSPFVLMHRMKFHPGAGSPEEVFSSLVDSQLEALVTQRHKIDENGAIPENSSL